jgi:hypothetical protein
MPCPPDILTVCSRMQRWYMERVMTESLTFSVSYLLVEQLVPESLHRVEYLLYIERVYSYNQEISRPLRKLWKTRLSAFLAFFPYFEKVKVGLREHLAVLLFMYPSHQILNALTNRYETSRIYHGTWANLNGILHKSLPWICLSVCVSLNRC